MRLRPSTADAMLVVSSYGQDRWSVWRLWSTMLSSNPEHRRRANNGDHIEHRRHRDDE